MSSVVSYFKRSNKQFKWLIAFLLIIILLPELCRFALIQLTPRSGWGDLSIDDIDLNVFTGRVHLSQVQLSQNQEPVLHVAEVALDIDWWQTLINEPTIEGVHVDGLAVSLAKNKKGEWYVLAPIEDTSSPKSHVIDKEQAADLLLPALTLKEFSLNNSQLKVNSQALKGLLSIEQIHLEKFSTVKDELLSLTLKAKWNNAAIVLDVKGDVKNKHQRLSGTLQLQQLQLNDFSALIGQSVSALVDTDMTIELDRTQRGEIKSTVSGGFSIADIDARYKALSLQSQLIDWQGDIAVKLGADTLEYTANNQLTVNQFSLNDDKGDILVTRFEQLQLADLALNQNLNVTGASLRIEKIDAMKSAGKSLGKFYNGLFELGAFNYSPQKGLALSTMRVRDAQYRASINKEGEFQLNGLIKTVIAALDDAEELADESTVSPDTVEQAEPFVYSVQAFTLAGDSHIRFEDQRFKPVFKQQLTLKTLSIRDFDNGDPNSTLKIKLQGSLGEFSDITMAGQVKPFGEQLALSMKGNIDSVDLPAISAYAEAYVGYQFTQGQFDHDFDISIANNHLQAINRLEIRQLELKRAEVNEAPTIEQQLNIPLDMALNLLRDSNNNIELDVPIDGQLDKLGVGLGDIISDALGNALTAGTTSFLKYALQPYGAIVMAAEYVGKQATSISLEPIAFEPGEALPPTAANEYSQKVVSLLQQRPALNISLCGVTNDKDRVALSVNEVPATQAQLLALAKQRAKLMKSQFMVKGVNSKRVFICKPQYQAEGLSGLSLKI